MVYGSLVAMTATQPANIVATTLIPLVQTWFAGWVVKQQCVFMILDLQYFVTCWNLEDVKQIF